MFELKSNLEKTKKKCIKWFWVFHLSNSYFKDITQNIVSTALGAKKYFCFYFWGHAEGGV